MTATRRAALAVALSAPIVVLSPQPSFAVPPFVVADVWVETWDGQWARLCGAGHVNDGATTISRWVFTVTGAVAEPIPIGPYVQIEDGDVFGYCDTFYVGSPPDAAFTITLTFAGLRPDTDLLNTDVTGGAVLVYEWDSATGHDSHVSFGTGG